MADKQRKSLTCMYEHMSAQVVGATEGSITVLTDMWFWTGGQASTICIQHHGLQGYNHEYRWYKSSRKILNHIQLKCTKESLSAFKTFVSQTFSYVRKEMRDSNKWLTFAASLRFLRALPPCPSPLLLRPFLPEDSFGSLPGLPGI